METMITLCAAGSIRTAGSRAGCRRSKRAHSWLGWSRRSEGLRQRIIMPEQPRPPGRDRTVPAPHWLHGGLPGKFPALARLVCGHFSRPPYSA